MCVMGEWSVGQWILGVISFKKIYGLYGLKHHIVEISGDVTDPDGRTNERTTRKDRATQLLICEALSFAIWRESPTTLKNVKICAAIGTWVSAEWERQHIQVARYWSRITARLASYQPMC